MTSGIRKNWYTKNKGVLFVTINTKLDILTDAVIGLLPEEQRGELEKAMRGSEKRTVTADTYAVAKQYLLKIGVNPALLGYRALANAVAIVVDDPATANQATKVVYPEAGKRIGKTGSQAEQSIRHVIEKWFETAELVYIRELFPVCDVDSGKVTNMHFINRVAANVEKLMGGITIC